MRLQVPARLDLAGPLRSAVGRPTGTGDAGGTLEAYAGPTEDYYYDESDQMVELHSGTIDASGVRTVNAAPRERELWDASYVNAPAVTELDDNSDGTRDRRLYATWDANYNITALVADHGHAVERYVWSPYGNDPEAHNGTAAYDGATLVLNGGESYTGSPDESYDWSARLGLSVAL